MAEHLLDIEGLHAWYKTYAGYAKVINGIDFKVDRGERVGLVGESGCGKTTTMKTILQIADTYVPQGKIFIDGKDVLKAKQTTLQGIRRKRVAMISQEPTAALNPVFSVGQQLGDIITNSGYLGRWPKREDIRRLAMDAITKVMIPDAERILNSYPHQLSGGMRQRVCIAAALSTPRELIIADEPGTALDVTIQDQIHRLLRQLTDSRESSLIMITHSLGVARELSDRIYVMYAGNIVEHAPVDELFEHPSHPYTKGLLDCVPRLSGGGLSTGIYGYVPDYLNPGPGCRFYNRCPYAKDECNAAPPPLYEISPGHTVACYRYCDLPAARTERSVGMDD